MLPADIIAFVSLQIVTIGMIGGHIIVYERRMAKMEQKLEDFVTHTNTGIQHIESDVREIKDEYKKNIDAFRDDIRIIRQDYKNHVDKLEGRLERLESLRMETVRIHDREA